GKKPLCAIHLKEIARQHKTLQEERVKFWEETFWNPLFERRRNIAAEHYLLIDKLSEILQESLATRNYPLLRAAFKKQHFYVISGLGKILATLDPCKDVTSFQMALTVLSEIEKPFYGAVIFRKFC